jgi:hypothetical protein
MKVLQVAYFRSCVVFTFNTEWTILNYPLRDGRIFLPVERRERWASSCSYVVPIVSGKTTKEQL